MRSRYKQNESAEIQGMEYLREGYHLQLSKFLFQKHNNPPNLSYTTG